MPGRADSYLVRCQSVSSRPGSLRWMFLEVLSKRVFFSFRGMVFRMIIMYQGGKCDGRYDVEIPSQRTDCRFDLQPCDGNSYFLPHQVDGEWDDSIRTWKIISVQCQSAKLSTVNTDGTTPSVKLPPQFCLSRDIMQHARLRTQKSRCLQPPLSFHLKVCAWTSVLKPTLGLTLTPLTRMNFDIRRFLSQKLHVYYIWQWQDISNMNTSLNLVCFKQRGGWWRVSNSCISFAGYPALISLLNSQKACPIEQVEIAAFQFTHFVVNLAPRGWYDMRCSGPPEVVDSSCSENKIINLPRGRFRLFLSSVLCKANIRNHEQVGGNFVFQLYCHKCKVSPAISPWISPVSYTR